MELTTSSIWQAALFLIGVQIAAFTWRVSRELKVGRKDIIWLPPADIMNLVGLIVVSGGVFILPLVGFDYGMPALAVSMILFVGYAFALAGHYDLYTRGGKRSYEWATRQEKAVVFITAVLIITFVILFVWRTSLH